LVGSSPRTTWVASLSTRAGSALTGAAGTGSVASSTRISSVASPLAPPCAGWPLTGGGAAGVAEYAAVAGGNGPLGGPEVGGADVGAAGTGWADVGGADVGGAATGGWFSAGDGPGDADPALGANVGQPPAPDPPLVGTAEICSVGLSSWTARVGWSIRIASVAWSGWAIGTGCAG